MKTTKRILSILLSLTLTMTGLVGTSVTANATDYNIGDIIEFGSYPQGEVRDDELINRLNLISNESTWLSYWYYSGTGDACDGNMTRSDYMKYIDVSADLNDDGTNEKYRGVKISMYRPALTGYKKSYSTTNTFQADNGYLCGNTYWFKYEPIEWRILNPSTGLIMSETILDAQPFNNYVYRNYDGDRKYYSNRYCTIFENDYGQSSIRMWLNNDFYNTSFANNEKISIDKRTIDYGFYKGGTLSYFAPGGNVDDKIFLLSYSDITNESYGFVNSSAECTERRANGTSYAKCQGLATDAEIKYYSGYGLRSCSTNTSSYCVVGYKGNINTGGYSDGVACYSTAIGVRPALYLRNFESTQHISDDSSLFYYFHDNKFYRDEFTYNNVAKYISDKPSTEYDPRMAAFAATMANAAGFKETLEATYNELGITEDHYESYCYGVFDYGIGSMHTAFSIADLKTDSGKPLIYITCRGTRDPGSWFLYGNIQDDIGKWEWIDDILNLGIALDNDGTSRHGGFQDCADYVLEKLDSYLIQHNIQKSNSVFVVTGHSRGAATANIVTADLMDKKGIQKKNIYCYTIACPDVAAMDANDWPNEKAKYNNVFNINNVKDPVSYLPGTIGSLVNQTWNTLPSLIETIKDPFGNHAKLFQWDKYGTSKWFSWNWNDDSQKSVDPMSHDQYDYWMYLKTLGTEFKDRNASQAITSWVSELIGNVFTWHCPVDAVVTDKSGNKIASVIDGKTDYYDSEVGDVLIFTSGDQKAIFIADGKDYDVCLIGTDAGTMDMEVARINPYSGKIDTDNYSTYTDVPLFDGETITASVQKDALPQDIAFFVIDENGQKTEQLQSISSVTPKISIHNFVPNRTIRYYTTIKFNSDTQDMPADTQVYWYINEKLYYRNHSSCEIYAATDDFTVQAKIVCGDKVLAESEIETVHISTRFFDMLFALFRILFQRPRFVEQ